jgi:hypothetical protein
VEASNDPRTGSDSEDAASAYKTSIFKFQKEALVFYIFTVKVGIQILIEMQMEKVEIPHNKGPKNILLFKEANTPVVSLDEEVSGIQLRQLRYVEGDWAVIVPTDVLPHLQGSPILWSKCTLVKHLDDPLNALSQVQNFLRTKTGSEKKEQDVKGEPVETISCPNCSKRDQISKLSEIIPTFDQAKKQQLSLPQKPVSLENRYLKSRLGTAIVWGVGIIAFLAGVKLDKGEVFLGIVFACVVAALRFGLSLYLENKDAKNNQAWLKAEHKWQELLSCQNCSQIFDSKEKKAIPAEKLQEYLFD